MATVDERVLAAPGGPEGLVLGDRPRSLAEVVYDAIYDAIVNKALEPGEALTEPGVARRLNVSKTPVREAFLRLRQTGLIEADGPRTLRVVRFSIRKLEEAYEMREAIEPYMAAVCAYNADDEARGRITRLAGASVAAAERGDLSAFREADTAFHAEIAETVENQRMTDANDSARALISTLRARDFPHADGVASCAEDHVAIADAIATHDAPRASEAMAAHIRKTRSLMLEGATGQDATAARGG